MDDASSSRRYPPKGVYMGHDIVSPALLLDLSHLEVFLGQLEVCLHLFNGFIGYGKPKLLLGLGKPEPELPPGAESSGVGEEGGHLLRGIAGGEGGLVGGVGHCEGCRRGWIRVW